MAKKRKKKGKGNLTLILVIAGVAVLGGVAWYIMKKRKEKKEKKDKINQHTIIPPVVNPPVSTTPVSTTTGYIYPQPQSNVVISTSGKKGCSGSFNTTSFPLKKYSCGDNVAKLQAYVGATADGKFGTATEKAVKSHQNLVVQNPVGWSAGYGKVSETDFINLKI